MAGSEKAGFEAARAGLYREAACILTPGPRCDEKAVRRLEEFWQALGCRTTQMDAAVHDEIVARISHLPHAAAVLAALAAFRPDPRAARFAAGGLRDTTRIAAGDPDMWCGILLENRDALMPALRDFREALDRLYSAMESRDGGTLHAMLAEAQQLRSTRYP